MPGRSAHRHRAHLARRPAAGRLAARGHARARLADRRRLPAPDRSSRSAAGARSWPVHAVAMHGELDIAAGRRIARIARAGNLAILHAHSSHALALGLWARFFDRRLRLVASRRVDFPIRGHFLSRLKYSTGTLDRIICISAAVRAQLARRRRPAGQARRHPERRRHPALRGRAPAAALPPLARHPERPPGDRHRGGARRPQGLPDAAARRPPRSRQGARHLVRRGRRRPAAQGRSRPSRASSASGNAFSSSGSARTSAAC